MPHGKLTVVLEGATDINTSRVYGRGGSFCTLACGSQIINSPTVEGGSHPLFKTVFEFEIDSTTNELNVCVYSKNSSSRDDELVGFCTLKFKKVFFFGYTVPLTAYPIQQPSGNPGGTVNISFKFKMRPSPNGHNTHAPMRCSPPRVAPNTVSRQSLSLDWGYDCHDEDASQAKSYRRTQSDPPRHQETYQNFPGSASDNPQTTTPHSHHESYLNLPGTDLYNDHESKPTFIRYGNPTRRRPNQSAQAPNHARLSPLNECSNPIPAYKPRPQSSQAPTHARPSPAYKPRPQSFQAPIHARPSPLTEYSKPIPQPQVIIRPQVQVPVQQKPSVLVHLGGEVVGGLAEGIGGELANQFLGGVGQAVLGALSNF